MKSDIRISCDIVYIIMIIYFWQFKLSSLKITNGASIGLKKNCVFQVTRQCLIYLPLWSFLRGFPSLAILFPHVFFNEIYFLPTIPIINVNVTWNTQFINWLAYYCIKVHMNKCGSLRILLTLHFTIIIPRHFFILLWPALSVCCLNETVLLSTHNEIDG